MLERLFSQIPVEVEILIKKHLSSYTEGMSKKCKIGVLHEGVNYQLQLELIGSDWQVKTFEKTQSTELKRC